MASERNSGEWHFGTAGVLLVGSLIAVSGVVAYPYGWYPAPAPAIMAGLCALFGALAGLLRKHDRPLVYYRAGLWLGFGAWATVVNLFSMSLMGFFVLGALNVAAAMLAPAFTPDPDPLTAAREADGVASVRTPEALRWKALIDKICSMPAPGVVITAIEKWEQDTGLTLTVEGPPGSGFTFQTINNEVTRLGAAARMKPGCVLHASEGGDHQGQAMLNVPLTYSTDEQVYPGDYSRRSVNEPLPIGFFPDRLSTDVEIRYGSVIIIGRKDGGKTTLLHNFTASLARCQDAIIWHIDMNNGGMSAPWLIPWLEEKCDVPVIDWFAHDDDEALFMSRVGLSIVYQRKVTYARRAARANSGNVPLDAEVPEILIMIDEGAEVLGEDAASKETGENIRKIMRLGRAVGVNVIMSCLRPVGDHLPVQIRKGCATRIAMRVEEKDEYDYTFDNSRGIAPHMIKQKGESFIVRSGMEDSPRKSRSYNLLPDQIVEISVATQGYRPDLDERSLVDPEMIRLYAERWDRCENYLRELMNDGPTPAAPAPAEVPGIEPERGGVATMIDDVPLGGADIDTLEANRRIIEKAYRLRDDVQKGRRLLTPEQWKALNDAIADGEATIAENEARLARLRERFAGGPDRDFEWEVTAFLNTLPVAEPVRPRQTVRTLGEGAALVVSIVKRPMSFAEIQGSVDASGKKVTRQTISDWCREAIAAERLERGSKKGEYQPCGWTPPADDES